MLVRVNGNDMELSTGAGLIDLLERLELTNARVAIELNQEIVPRSLHAEQRLQDGDQIEIVHAIGGG